MRRALASGVLRASARSFSTTRTKPRLCWTDVYAEQDKFRLRSSSDGLLLQRSEPVTCAALGAPVYTGRHQVSIEAKGTSLIVGLAEALPGATQHRVDDKPLDPDNNKNNPWTRKAWGVALWSGRLFECDSMTALSEQVAQAYPRPDAPVLSEEDMATPTDVRISVDTKTGTLRFVSRGGEWVSTIKATPGPLRPWVLFAGPGQPSDNIRLVASADVLVMPPLETRQIVHSKSSSHGSADPINLVGGGGQH